MVDTLVGHFESSAYMSPNRRNTAVAKTGVRKVMVENTKQKGVREMKKRIPAGPPVKAPRQAVEAVESVESVDIVDLAPPIIAEVRTEDIVFGTQGESCAMIRREMQSRRRTKADVSWTVASKHADVHVATGSSIFAEW
jgi:hypothetical protein